MNNELNTLSSRGSLIIYDFINIDLSDIKWKTKKASFKEEELLFPLKSEVNKLIGYVCQCKISPFAKISVSSIKEVEVPKNSENPVNYFALFVENDPYDIVYLYLENKKIAIEKDMLILIDAKRYDKLTVTGNLNLLSLSIHEYSI